MQRVLIVEDNEMNRDMLSRRLLKRGYQVSMAVDAESGLDQARLENPDIILMDMSLPGITGWEAAAILKADPNTRRIPIIALTAHAMESDRQKALAAGCDDFETKPVQLAELLAKMDGLMSGMTPSRVAEARG